MSETSHAIILSSLEKIFPDSVLEGKKTQNYSMLQNEKFSFQIAVQAHKGDKIAVKAKTALSPYIRFFYVKLIPAGYCVPEKPDSYYIAGTKSMYPDLLQPLEGNTFSAEYEGWNVVWCELAGENLPAGSHELNITASVNGNSPVSDALELSVIPALLPKQKLIYTNWFYTDCLMSYYKLEAFSEEYWRITENFLKRAVEYGMNCVLTPLFTPPLDTKIGSERPTVQLVDVTVTQEGQYAFAFDKLDRWFAMCERCGIEYYEMSHLFTQWGAKNAPKIIAFVDGQPKQIFGWGTKAAGKEYKAFLEQFSQALSGYIKEKGLKDNCLFHVSDEPNKKQIRQYKKASRVLHKYFGEYRTIDALSDYKIYKKGLIETPIPSNDHIQKFIGKVPELWTYYCCSQAYEYVSNRFFSMPSQRNRVLGYQLYKFNVKGFLHWGYNYYYRHLTPELVNPFEEADAGGKLPSGDAFVVYPGEDGTPLDSLRLRVFYDGLQDLRALNLLEQLVGRDKTLRLLEEGTSEPLTFSSYPQSAAWQLETRQRINQAIAQAVANS